MNSETARYIAVGCFIVQIIFIVFSWKFLDDKIDPSRAWHFTGIIISLTGLLFTFFWFSHILDERESALVCGTFHFISSLSYISEYHEVQRKQRHKKIVNELGGKK